MSSGEKQALLQAAGCQPGPAYDSKHRTKPQPGPAYDSGSAYAADIGTNCPANPTSTTRNKSRPKKIKPPPMSSLDPADNPVKVNQLTKPASNKAPDRVHVRQIIPHHSDVEAEKPLPGLAPDSRSEVASALQHHHPSQAQPHPRTQYPQYPPPIPMYHYQVAPSQNQQTGGYGTIAQVGTHPQQNVTTHQPKPVKTSFKFDTKTVGDNQYYFAICLLCCGILCCNPFALLFTIPAFYCAHKAATFNKEGLLEEAQKYHKRAYGCNLCSAATIATYGGIALVGIIVGVYYGVALISVQ